MTEDQGDVTGKPTYGMTVANGSYDWYKTAAIRSRRAFRGSEIALIVVAAIIPASAAVQPHNAITPAILGAIVVILSGTRAVFHWQENYLRFSGAREAIAAERRLYYTSSPPYNDANTRDQVLVASVSKIEQDEMGTWIKVATDRPKA